MHGDELGPSEFGYCGRRQIDPRGVSGEKVWRTQRRGSRATGGAPVK